MHFSKALNKNHSFYSKKESTLGKNTAIDSNNSVIPANPKSNLKTKSKHAPKSNFECMPYKRPGHSEVPQTKLPKVTTKRLNETKSSNYHVTMLPSMPNDGIQYLHKCSRCGINFKKTSDFVKHVSKKCSHTITKATKTIHVSEKQYQILKDNSTSERDEKIKVILRTLKPTFEKIAVEAEIPSTSKLNIKSECHTDVKKEILESESFKDYVAGLCETKIEIKDESL